VDALEVLVRRRTHAGRSARVYGAYWRLNDPAPALYRVLAGVMALF
jgi:hypothetical protein